MFLRIDMRTILTYYIKFEIYEIMCKDYSTFLHDLSVRTKEYH